ncbi:MAG: hypothetical protein NTZ49_01760 [Candidatus Parcubacteria bacterium]|nr:hypothetical protein [Candidatus Parcubacteria bacterium]
MDSHSCAKTFADILQDEGHEVVGALNPSDANGYWIYNPGNFDCIIIDVTGTYVGLTEAEQKQTKDGWTTGWIWLKNYILKEKPDFASRVIIFSTSESLEILDEADPSARQKVRIVCKNGEGSVTEALLAELEQISNLALC